MEVKKNKKADLESKRTMFLQIGFILTLGAVLVAFEWSTTHVTIAEGLNVDDEIFEMEEIPVTTHEEKVEIKPPTPISFIDEIVPDDEELLEDLDIIDTEMDMDAEIDVSDLMHEEVVDESPIPFFILEEKPKFPGGDKALMQYIMKNVNYPVICQENGVEEKIFVSFVINKTGKVTDVKLLRGEDPNLSREAMRVVQSLPDWEPGMQRGKAVNVSFQIPVNFQLQ
jgi:protein TonB